jgi:hypothetical protein
VAVLVGVGVGDLLGDGPTVFIGGVGDGEGVLLGDGPTVFIGGVGDGVGDAATVFIGGGVDGLGDGDGATTVAETALVSVAAAGRAPQPAAAVHAACWRSPRPGTVQPTAMPPASAATAATASNGTARRFLKVLMAGTLAVVA